MPKGKKSDARISNTTGSNTDADVLTEIESHVFELVEQYINALDNPDEIYNNNGLFVDMLKYIYKYYISALLGNNNSYGNRYDYKVLDELFSIYTTLVYRYKKNNRPLISEYCIFTHVSENTLDRIRCGSVKKISDGDIENVKRWFTECKNALANGSNVFEIFLLKACYGLNDNLAPIPIDIQNVALSAKNLPDLSKAEEKTPAGIPEKP